MPQIIIEKSNSEHLDEIIEKLKSSPLFYLFLSSKELFHSNFWYWLSILNKKETVKLFSNKSFDLSQISFEREKNKKNGEFKSKIDLLISFNCKPAVVIENKVKDFPTLEQLNRIKDSLNGEIDYVLTTLFWYKDLSFKGWFVKTYKEISKSIIPSNFTTDDYYQKLIADYKSLIFTLSELSSLLPLNSIYDFAISFNKKENNKLYQKLNEIKLWESYQKLRTSHLLNDYQQKYPSTSEYIKTDFKVNNQKATISFYVEFPNMQYSVGVQIEDNQFRKVVIGKNAEQFAHNLIKKGVFFKQDASFQGGKPFLKYGNEFKYQYFKLNKSLAFNELFEMINKNLVYIKKNEEEIQKSIPV